jgi:hypothetical protein
VKWKAWLAMKTGGGENGMDEEEDKDAAVSEEGVNPSTAPPNIFGNLLHSVDICVGVKDNNDKGGINSSFPSNDDEEH